MNREILFRGKSRDSGKWRFGVYMRYSGGAQIWTHDADGGTWNAIVDPATVGQYTGLTDKNGKKIFEGDIVRYKTYNDFVCNSVVRFGEYEQDGSGGEYSPTHCVGLYAEIDNFAFPDWADDGSIDFRAFLRTQNLLEVSDGCEVIGNIHDNPELLEVK